MPALHSIKAQNFLSLKDVEVRLDQLNVLVGPNGAGKTNLLRIIQFLGDTVRTDLRPAIENHGGYHNLVFRGAQSGPRLGPIRLEIKAAVTRYATPGALDHYVLTIQSTRAKRGDEVFEVIRRNESFSFKRYRGRGRRITVTGGRVHIVDQNTKRPAQQEIALDSFSSGLSTLRRLGEAQGAEQISQLAALFETFRIFEVNVSAARKPSLIAEESHLASDASNLARTYAKYITVII